MRTNDKWSHGGRQISVTKQLETLLQHHFPIECAENVMRHAAETGAGGGEGEGGAAMAEEQESGSSGSSGAQGQEAEKVQVVVVPIFCCSVALPGVTTGLHVFEPRYRLMMRRCIESGQKKFGMCLDQKHEYGTMLRIVNYEQLADGRSRVDCIGEERFRVVSWGEKDGYSTGRVTWVDDTTTEAVMEVVEEEVEAGVEVVQVEEVAVEEVAVEEVQVEEVQVEVVEEIEEVAMEVEEDVEVTSSVASSLVMTTAEVTAEKVQTMRTSLRRVLALSVWDQLEEMLGTMPESKLSENDDADVQFVFWAGSVLAACGILEQEKLYDLAFGGPTNVVIVDGKPTWTNVENGEEGNERLSLRDSHDERVRVLELYVAAVVRAGEERASS